MASSSSKLGICQQLRLVFLPPTVIETLSEFAPTIFSRCDIEWSESWLPVLCSSHFLKSSAKMWVWPLLVKGFLALAASSGSSWMTFSRR